MTSERSALEAELLQLKNRVAQIEGLLRPSLPTTRTPEPALSVTGNDYYRWIDEHPDLMSLHPDCFIAIDPTLGNDGLVVHEVDGSAFSRQVLKLYESDPTARERVMLTHTSIY